jgi:hypothetical protein
MFTASIQRSEKLHFYLEDEVGTSLSNVRRILPHFIIRIHKTLYYDLHAFIYFDQEKLTALSHWV